MANLLLKRIKDWATSITAFRTGDVIPVDGPSGTAKMSKDDLLKETAENTLVGNELYEDNPNPEYAFAITDSDGIFLCGVKSDGTFVFNDRERDVVNIAVVENIEYKFVLLDADDMVLGGILNDGTFVAYTDLKVNGSIKNALFEQVVTDLTKAKSDISEIETTLDNAGISVSPNRGNLTSFVKKEAYVVFDENVPVTIYDVVGEGQIEEMYFAGDYNNWHNAGETILEVYCDDILCIRGKLWELAGLFFDIDTYANYKQDILETPLFSKLGKNNSICLNFKIPYYHKCKVQLVKNSFSQDHIWTTVRATDKFGISYGGVSVPYGAYFKAVTNTEANVAAGGYHSLYSASNYSMMIGCNLCMISDNNYSMEGCVRAFFDDNSYQYLSSGLEDFFISTYYFDNGEFARYKAGVTKFVSSDSEGADSCKLGAYRQFTDNPICFNEAVNVKVRNGDSVVSASTDPISDTLLYTPGLATYKTITFHYEWN